MMLAVRISYNLIKKSIFIPKNVLEYAVSMKYSVDFKPRHRHRLPQDIPVSISEAVQMPFQLLFWGHSEGFQRSFQRRYQTPL